jgi:hypothetical protein
MKEFLMLIRENAEYGEMTARQMQDGIALAKVYRLK